MGRAVRFISDSIAARTALTLVAALILTQVVSGLIYLTDRGEGRAVHSLRELGQRVVAIVQLVESVPPAQRPRVVRAVDDPVLGVTWHRDRPRLGDNRVGFPFDLFRRRIAAALHLPPRAIVLETPHPPPPVHAAGPLALDERPRGGTLRIALPLSDGSWLTFVPRDAPEGPFRLLRFALWMGLVALVIVLLSWWAARRLTAPLARLAAAAERLGVDGEVPPLPERGPRELRVATRAFNQMQERLRRFVSDRTQMLAAISHDLRTPLTRLRLRAEFVEDPEQQRKMLADLDEMEAMIAATLAFARDDARCEPRVAVDLGALLQSLCDDLADAGLPATYQGPARRPFAGRPVALRRAIGNLVDNAIKYGGGARVSLVEGAGEVIVRVEDDGVGIPETELEKVFAPFYRLERSRSRDTGGTGLGLSTARTIARAHGGDVRLANRPAGGLRAELVLPEAG